MYQDGVGITNPFSANSSIQSSSVFSFSLLNLPRNSALSTMHLIALCNSLDLKSNDGYNHILESITEELEFFEKEGLDDHIPGKGIVKIFGTISLFTGDNLAINQTFGFTESFSGDYCCIFCYATRHEMQVYSQERDFQMRTIGNYENDLNELEVSQSAIVRGIKRSCPLNRLQFWHLISNAVNDIMHTFLQGVLPHVTSCVLYSLWKDDIITLDSFNNRLQEIFLQVKVDKKSKPSELNSFLNPGSGLSPKYSAAQTWTLFRYIPVMIGHKATGKKYWKMFMMLQEVVDIVFAPRLTETILVEYSILYSEFLILYKEIYPTLTVKPKMHFAIHFPTAVRHNGPMKICWAMGFERQNGVMKRPSHVMNNFRNPQKTSAYRYTNTCFST